MDDELAAVADERFDIADAATGAKTGVGNRCLGGVCFKKEGKKAKQGRDDPQERAGTRTGNCAI